MAFEIPASAYTSAVVAVAIPILFGFFKASGFFSRTRRVHETLTLKQLAAKYLKWEAFSIVLWLILTPACVYLAYLGLKALARALQPPPDPDVIFLPVTDMMWLLPAIFIGIILSATPIILLLKLMMGSRYDEFECYSDMKAGFNTNRAFGFISVIVVTLALAFSAAALDFYWRFEKDRFAINPFFKPTEIRYAYSDILELRLIAKFRAPNGKLSNTPYYEIVATNGDRWNSKRGPEDDPAVLQPLFAFLERKSGVRVMRYELSPDDTER